MMTTKFPPGQRIILTDKVFLLDNNKYINILLIKVIL